MRRDLRFWSLWISYSLALWLVALPTLLGYLAGWRLDAGTGRVAGRLAFGAAGAVFGLMAAWRVLRPRRGT